MARIGALLAGSKLSCFCPMLSDEPRKFSMFLYVFSVALGPIPGANRKKKNSPLIYKYWSLSLGAT